MPHPAPPRPKDPPPPPPRVHGYPLVPLDISWSRKKSPRRRHVSTSSSLHHHPDSSTTPWLSLQLCPPLLHLPLLEETDFSDKNNNREDVDDDNDDDDDHQPGEHEEGHHGADQDDDDDLFILADSFSLWALSERDFHTLTTNAAAHRPPHHHHHHHHHHDHASDHHDHASDRTRTTTLHHQHQQQQQQQQLEWTDATGTRPYSGSRAMLLLVQAFPQIFFSYDTTTSPTGTTKLTSTTTRTRPSSGLHPPHPQDATSHRPTTTTMKTPPIISVVELGAGIGACGLIMAYWNQQLQRQGRTSRNNGQHHDDDNNNNNKNDMIHRDVDAERNVVGRHPAGGGTIAPIWLTDGEDLVVQIALLNRSWLGLTPLDVEIRRLSWDTDQQRVQQQLSTPGAKTTPRTFTHVVGTDLLYYRTDTRALIATAVGLLRRSSSTTTTTTGPSKPNISSFSSSQRTESHESHHQEASWEQNDDDNELAEDEGEGAIFLPALIRSTHVEEELIQAAVEHDLIVLTLDLESMASVETLEEQVRAWYNLQFLVLVRRRARLLPSLQQALQFCGARPFHSVDNK